MASLNYKKFLKKKKNLDYKKEKKEKRKRKKKKKRKERVKDNLNRNERERDDVVALFFFNSSLVLFFPVPSSQKSEFCFIARLISLHFSALLHVSSFFFLGLCIYYYIIFFFMTHTYYVNNDIIKAVFDCC